MASTSTGAYAALDDPDLFAERSHTRERIALLPRGNPERARLCEVYEALTKEFDRRARSAWQTATEREP